jgi:hypothetical protein
MDRPSKIVYIVALELKYNGDLANDLRIKSKVGPHLDGMLMLVTSSTKYGEKAYLTKGVELEVTPGQPLTQGQLDTMSGFSKLLAGTDSMDTYDLLRDAKRLLKGIRVVRHAGRKPGKMFLYAVTLSPGNYSMTKLKTTSKSDASTSESEERKPKTKRSMSSMSDGSTSESEDRRPKTKGLMSSMSREVNRRPKTKRSMSSMSDERKPKTKRLMSSMSREVNRRPKTKRLMSSMSDGSTSESEDRRPKTKGLMSSMSREVNPRPTKRLMDPNAPRKPLTPYGLYVSDVRYKTMSQNPDQTPDEIYQKLRDDWLSLSGLQKQYYINLNGENTLDYQRKLKKYLSVKKTMKASESSSD